MAVRAPAAPPPKGQRTAAAMERNRRGARKFRERQSRAPLKLKLEMGLPGCSRKPSS